MKPRSSTRDASDKASSSARHEPGRGKGHEYRLALRYYTTMKPQRVYPLVVEVPAGRGAVADGTPAGVTVTLRPVVPGAVVVPADLQLDVSRPGARATFQVTPVARGRLPEARVQVYQGSRLVQELRTTMKAKTQRGAWLLLLLALVGPLLLLYATVWEPMQGQVKGRRLALEGEQRRQLPRQIPGMGGAAPAEKPPVEDKPPEERQPDTIEYMRAGLPGEVLAYRLEHGLIENVPEFPHSRDVFQEVAYGAGVAYGWLCGAASDMYPAFWLGVVLLIAAFGAWVLHRPTRVRRRGTVLLAAAPAAAPLRAETAETLPLAPPYGERE